MTQSIPQLPVSRRAMLHRMGAGFGSLGLAGVLHGADSPSRDQVTALASAASPLSPKLPHFAPKAKRIIQLFMPGGPSQVDTFDYKPEINRYGGQRPTLVNRKSLRNTKGGLFPSPFGFQRYGKCGKWVSDLFPRVGQCVDELCFIHSMHTDIPEHAGAILMMNLGHLQPSRPSMGSWLVYGLGTENQNLPGFVAMSPRAQPRGKLANWGNSFLPGAYAGCYVNIASMHPQRVMSDLQNPNLSRSAQRKQADLLTRLNQLDLQRQERDQTLESSIQAMEMAFRMQFAVPDTFDLSRETRSTLDMYGTSEYAKGCLLARRLIERGVRAVQLSHSIDGYDIAWDTGHNDIAGGHKRLADACDQGIAALLTDLKQRGLLDETLVLWGGEFGRAPTSEGQKGRDHDHYGFTVWMAGGGVKPGFSYGATDVFGLTAVENRVHVHDLHATILHLMGLDHERLTYRYSGRDFRLTDVHGQVIQDVLL
ncbi:MAG: sulfatase [Planctomycetaceae bacterium]|nr:sulfatase [Planctomycetaceae bacterium]